MAGYEQTVGDVGGHVGADAVALVAHHDEAVGGQGLPIDVVSVEEGAINRCGGG